MLHHIAKGTLHLIATTMLQPPFELVGCPQHGSVLHPPIARCAHCRTSSRSKNGENIADFAGFSSKPSCFGAEVCAVLACALDPLYSELRNITHCGVCRSRTKCEPLQRSGATVVLRLPPSYEGRSLPRGFGACAPTERLPTSGNGCACGHDPA
jgi:hypothetical protein